MEQHNLTNRSNILVKKDSNYVLGIEKGFNLGITLIPQNTEDKKVIALQLNDEEARTLKTWLNENY